MNRNDKKYKSDLERERKNLQDLIKREDELDVKLTSGNFNEDTWRELNNTRYKITVSKSKIDGSFYKGEPEPQAIRTSNSNQYNN